jgi:hypothetical protein
MSTTPINHAKLAVEMRQMALDRAGNLESSILRLAEQAKPKKGAKGSARCDTLLGMLEDAQFVRAYLDQFSVPFAANR